MIIFEKQTGKAATVLRKSGNFAVVIITTAMRPLDRNILSLALPSIIQNVTVPLLGLVDLTIVGHLGSAKAMGAIAVGSMIFNVIYWLLGFLRMGTSGLTSQAYGRRDVADARRLLCRVLLIAFSLGLLLVAAQWPLGWLALRVIHPSADVVPLARLYFNICIWGAPAVLGLYGLNGWFIGMQDTRTPLYVAIAQNLLNIVASLSFVYLLHLDIAGVALGTLTAQWFGLAVSLAFAVRRYRRLDSELQGGGDGQVTPWSRFFSVNRDIFIRTLFLVAVNLFFTSVGAREGDVILSANSVLLTFYTLFSYIMDGFAFAGEAVCGRSFGSGDRALFQASVKRLFFWGWMMTLLFTVVYAVGGMPLVRFMTSEQSVIAMIGHYFPWVLLIPVCGMAAFVYDGVFIGMTATRGMLVSSVTAALLFFALFFLGLALHLPTNHLLWTVYLAYLLARGIGQYIWMRCLTPDPSPRGEGS
jgi:MATE family multidrug resistance protein